jgi:hypothetical protein
MFSARCMLLFLSLKCHPQPPAPGSNINFIHTPGAYVPQDKQAKSVMSYNLKWTGVITIHHLPCVMLLLKESRDPPI